MLLSHAVLFAEARSYLAALADTAPGFDTSLEYERVLLQLDHLHHGQVTPITVVPTGDRTVLYDVARTAITRLVDYGVDRYELAICLSMLATAWETEHQP
jgi:hypothetical protein